MPDFERSVFINCPFDDEFSPILQAIAFCVSNLGFVPRIATENPDNAANRLDRVVQLVKGSKFAIHDISRCKSTEPDEFMRLNMPFELGIDFGCQKFGNGKDRSKSVLVLENRRFDYQKALSDISGWDIQAHNGDPIVAVRHVVTWLVRSAGAVRTGPARLLADYATFQEWYWERELESGASEDDIRAYPTIQMIDAMMDWVAVGRPV
jgi:hypothetical protein